MCIMVHGASLYRVSARLVQYAHSDIRTRSVCSVDKSIVSLGLMSVPLHARTLGVTVMRLRHAVDPRTIFCSLINHGTWK